MNKSVSIREALSGWEQSELINLMAILGKDVERISVEDLERELKWLYHSKSRAQASKLGKNIVERIASKAKKREQELLNIDELYDVPDFSDIVVGVARQLKVFDKGVGIEKLEIYISHAIIIKALDKMNPSKREMFFTEELDTSEIVEKAGSGEKDFKGPATILSLLGMANTAGMGLYVASAAALGFVTHAVGVTLPFAVYTSLTSTIAFVIGPVGWMGVGIWGFLSLTGSDWKKLIPAILYISHVNSAKAFNHGLKPSLSR